MWSKDLARLEFVHPDLFVGNNKDEERVCAFALALALYFNDSKSIVGMTVHLIEGAPKFDSLCEETGEYFGLKGYLNRLMIAHLHELHHLFQHRFKEASDKPLFQKIVRGMPLDVGKNWEALVAMALDRKGPDARLLKNIRDGMAFHYVRHEGLYAGYLAWKAELRPGGLCQDQEGAYFSIASSVKKTRYYFADAAADFWLKDETGKGEDIQTLLPAILDRNANAISGFLSGFINHRGGRVRKSSYPKIVKRGDA